jgi:2-polyprenyl-3-methyl-5-hydroxy-6-metoxy-1,4-benzoquinol methylase
MSGQDHLDRTVDRTIDQDRMAALMQRLIADLGATIAAGGVVVGDRLGLYRALAQGRTLPQELARRTGTAPRYVEEWLRAQAAGGYVEYDVTTGEYYLTPEQARAMADPESEIYAPLAFQLALGALKAAPSIAEAFRTGAGVPWFEHDSDVFVGCARLVHSGCRANLVSAWLPALDGVLGKLRHGARVGDVGCGHGSITTLMARAFPASDFVGWDGHEPAVKAARDAAEAAGLAGRLRFEIGGAHCLDGGPYDLVTMFHVLHCLGDPLGAARRIRDQLAPDGTWLIVEPAAGPSVSANLTPVGRMYYAFSTFLCVPNALAEEGGYSLGAQAGELPVRRLVGAAGFTRFRRVAQDALHAVYEARP